MTAINWKRGQPAGVRKVERQYTRGEGGRVVEKELQVSSCFPEAFQNPCRTPVFSRTEGYTGCSHNERTEDSESTH